MSDLSKVGRGQITLAWMGTIIAGVIAMILLRQDQPTHRGLNTTEEAPPTEWPLPTEDDVLVV